MADAFTYKALHTKFLCGNNYEGLSVIRFLAPGGAEICAYSCNMNIDMDGGPQSYGPLYKAGITPIENLWNGGFLTEAQNAVRKAAYDAAKKIYDDLVAKKADLVAKAKAAPAPATPPATPPAADPAMIALDDQIPKAKQKMIDAASSKWGKSYWDEDPKKRPAKFGEIFWDWFGPMSLTPGDAAKLSYVEKNVTGPNPPRKPQLDPTAYYQDVFGRFPVIQSRFEPGPGYYVSVFPPRVNTMFTEWDQRAFLPVDATKQVPNGALSTILEGQSGLHLNDMVLAVRLDNGDTLTFPFLDRGGAPKVAECSVEAFTAIGGVVAANVNASDNRFVLLYLAFAKSAGETQAAVLSKFAATSNADDLPVMLSFIAQATLNAKNKAHGAPISVNHDPMRDFEAWQKSWAANKPLPMPSTFEVVKKALKDAGFRTFSQRIMEKHPSIGGAGPWLTPPQRP